VPGSALGCATLELISKHGFPAGKRLGAGVVDGRSVWADGDAPTALLGSLVKQVPLIQIQCNILTRWKCYSRKVPCSRACCCSTCLWTETT
jgi:Cobalamin-independent synthase, N-terminal domain